MQSTMHIKDPAETGSSQLTR